MNLKNTNRWRIWSRFGCRNTVLNVCTIEIQWQFLLETKVTVLILRLLSMQTNPPTRHAAVLLHSHFETCDSMIVLIDDIEISLPIQWYTCRSIEMVVLWSCTFAPSTPCMSRWLSWSTIHTVSIRSTVPHVSSDQKQRDPSLSIAKPLESMSRFADDQTAIDSVDHHPHPHPAHGRIDPLTSIFVL